MEFNHLLPPGDPFAVTPFASLRNLHSGQTFIVCGCGQSLKTYQQDHPFLTIGVNDVGRFFTPDYLLVLNPPHDFSGDRWIHTYHTRSRAVFSHLELAFADAPLIRFQLGERNGTTFEDPNCLPYTRNSPYAAIALAVHLGARNIGLLGVDFTPNHFFQKDGPHPLAGDLKTINNEYTLLAESLAARGIQVTNLSFESRITAFPKQEWHRFVQLHGPDPKTSSISTRIPLRSRALKVTIEQRTEFGVVSQFMDTLAASLKRCGIPVTRLSGPNRANHGDVSFVWNGRYAQSSGVLICCEHGWLPTWYYQMGLQGVNANANFAPFHWNGQTPSDQAQYTLTQYLRELRSQNLSRARLSSSLDLSLLPPRFILAPLQLERDSNIVYHAPVALQTMQGFVDHLSACNPDLPIVFKQHPVDARGRNQHLKLRLHRPQDRLLPHQAGSIHQILETGRCLGLFAINSNSVHDALLWETPSVVLGRNVWPRNGESPFLNEVPSRTSLLQEHYLATQSCRQAYLLYLINHQWSLKDLENTKRLAEFFESCALHVAEQT